MFNTTPLSLMNHIYRGENVNRRVLAEDICLRRVSRADRPLCESLFIEAHQGPLQLAGWDEDQCRNYLAPQFDMRERGFKQQYPQADDDMIQIDGIDVGRMIINRQQLGIHIIDIVIFNNWRQRGIGSYLLNELCNEADVKDPDELHRRTGHCVRACSSKHIRVLYNSPGGMRISVEITWRHNSICVNGDLSSNTRRQMTI